MKRYQFLVSYLNTRHRHFARTLSGLIRRAGAKHLAFMIFTIAMKFMDSSDRPTLYS